MKQNKNDLYMKTAWNQFTASFKSLDLRVFNIVFFDIVFVSILLLLLRFWNSAIQTASRGLDGVNFGQEMIGSETIINANIDIMRSFLRKMFIYFILFIVLFFIAYILTRLFIWLNISKKKFSRNFVKNFLLMNIIWLIIWLIIAFIGLSGFRSGFAVIAAPVLIFLYLHLTTVVYTVFTEKLHPIKSMKQGFITAFNKIHYFIVPYLFALIIAIILNRILSLFTGIDARAYLFITTIVFLFYAAWARIYIYSVARGFVK